MIYPPPCKTCPYWFNADPDVVPRQAICIKFPPTYTGPGSVAEDVANDHERWLQPVTLKFDSCGEHPDFPEYLAAFKNEQQIEAAKRKAEERLAAKLARKAASHQSAAPVTTMSPGTAASQ